MQTIAHSIEKRGEVRGERRGEIKGMKMGMQKNKLAIAKSMLKDDESIEKIAKWTGFDKATIKKLQKDLK